MVSRTNDRAYHEARALAEDRLAQEADDPAIAALHRQLCALHRRKMMEIVAAEPAVPPPLPGVTGP